MLFRNIIISAVLIGVLAGLVLSVGQHFQVSSIIYAAEEFEVNESSELSPGHSHDSHAHEHNETAWSPDDGAERITYTVIANILSAIGFAAVLLTMMAIVRLKTAHELTLVQGFFWGLSGYLAFFVAPSIGLPPEIPGMQAAALESRQLWWVLTVSVTAVGLAVIAFARSWHKVGGILLLAIPHVLGAPSHSGAAFSHPDPAAVKTLQALHESFLWASALTNGVFWILLGLLAVIALKKWQWQQAV